MNYNRIVLVGRLTRDPEAKYTPSGVPVTTFAIAVNRPQSAEARQQGAKEEADFFDIVCWRQTAEYAANYLQKGRLVLAEGRVQIRAYVDREGQQRKAFEVVADNVRSMEKRADGEGGGGGDDAFGGGNQDRGYDRGAQAAPARGGYDQGGGQAQGGRGGYDRQPAAAPAVAPARGGQPAPAARGGARNQPVDNFDDNDMEDPFAE